MREKGYRGFAMDEPTRFLVDRAQANDASAAGLLFERYRQRLRRALHRMVAPAAGALVIDTEDALQDAILAALRGIGRFEYRGDGSFLAWMLQTARREFLHRLRDAQAKKRTAPRQPWSDVGEPAGGGDTPSGVAMGKELEARIQACLAQMPERERSVLVLSRYLDSPTTEIQEELSLPSPGAVRALLARAQARLAKLLALPPVGPPAGPQAGPRADGLA